MLEKVPEQIAYCHDRAREYREKAQNAATEAISEQYLELERCWLLLAQSYVLTDRTSEFTRELDRRHDPSVLWEGWQRIANAPFDRDLELAVIDYDGPHALVFPCRRILGGWMSVQTKARIDLRPTHWRDWNLKKESD